MSHSPALRKRLVTRAERAGTGVFRRGGRRGDNAERRTS